MKPKSKSKTKRVGPHPIDIFVGERIRARRISLGMTKLNLAATLGITFQQFQKNEKGTNRVSASRLYLVAAALQVSVSSLFPDQTLAGTDDGAVRDIEQFARFVKSDDVRALNNAFMRIGSPSVRKKLFRLLDQIAKSFSDPGGDED